MSGHLCLNAVSFGTRKKERERKRKRERERKRGRETKREIERERWRERWWREFDSFDPFERWMQMGVVLSVPRYEHQNANAHITVARGNKQ